MKTMWLSREKHTSGKNVYELWMHKPQHIQQQNVHICWYVTNECAVASWKYNVFEFLYPPSLHLAPGECVEVLWGTENGITGLRRRT